MNVTSLISKFSNSFQKCQKHPQHLLYLSHIFLHPGNKLLPIFQYFSMVLAAYLKKENGKVKINVSQYDLIFNTQIKK